MKEKIKTNFLIIVLILIVVFPISFWVISEIRWAEINSPDGKFTNVTEYLAQDRKPVSIKKIEKEGNVYFIAFGPLDSWLAAPSGPAAYVFDADGKMVDWAGDSGEADDFNSRWPWPERKDSDLEELKKIMK